MNIDLNLYFDYSATDSFQRQLEVSRIKTFNDQLCDDTINVKILIYTLTILQIFIVLAFVGQQLRKALIISPYGQIIILICIFKLVSSILLSQQLITCKLSEDQVRYVYQIFASLDIVTKCFVLYYLTLISYGLGMFQENLERKRFQMATIIMMIQYVTQFIEEITGSLGPKLIIYTIVISHLMQCNSQNIEYVLELSMKAKTQRVYDIYLNSRITLEKLNQLNKLLVIQLFCMVTLESSKNQFWSQVFGQSLQNHQVSFIIFQFLIDLFQIIYCYALLWFQTSKQSNSELNLDRQRVRSTRKVYELKNQEKDSIFQDNSTQENSLVNNPVFIKQMDENEEQFKNNLNNYKQLKIIKF